MPSLLPRSSSTKEQWNEEGSGGSRSHLYLNVYDLSPINNYLYWFGLGIFHSGIEVHGMEYGFGAHDYPTSGVFELSGKYHGDTYHLIAKNCNHFTDDVCMHLTGKPIPGWVNRLARLGSFCNCLLPESIQVSAVRHLPDHHVFSEDGSVSYASTMEDSDDDGPNRHLLSTPRSDPPYSREKQLKLARDIL